MMPSQWAQYCAAVADVTGLTAKVIWEDLPLAIGKQYEAVFYAKHRIKLQSLDKAPRVSQEPGLKKVIR
jgi:hypothetical protein